MKNIKHLLIVLTLISSTYSYCQLESTLSEDDIKDLIPILKNDSTLFCNELDRFNIGFFPTSELVSEFKDLGMPSEVIKCLKENFPDNLKFHVIHFECFSSDCGKWITKDLSVETKEAIFDEKASNEAFRKFSRKEIADYIKDEAKFDNPELPSVFLTGIVHKSDSSFTAVIRLKYQNQHSIGGQRLAAKGFEFKSAKRKDIKAGCKRIAIWALDTIENEINQ